MGYYDYEDEIVCNICKDVDCDGCPGNDEYVDEGEPQSIWDDADDGDGLSREDYAVIEADIRAEQAGE